MKIPASNQTINFCTPLVFSKSFLKEKKGCSRFFIHLGASADNYLYLGKRYIHASNLEESLVKGHVWKTALKIVSYVLTAFVLPLLALFAKLIYKNWAAKNLSVQQKEQLKGVEKGKLSIESKKIDSQTLLKSNEVPANLNYLDRIFQEKNNSEIKELTDDISAFKKDLETIPLPGKDAEENECLSKIRMTLPLSDDQLEKVLVAQAEFVTDKQEHRKKFPFLSNSTLIHGLPYFKMTPSSLVKDLAVLMKDSNTPMQIKGNLLDIYEILLQSPFYVDEIKSEDFKNQVHLFAEAVEGVKGSGIINHKNRQVVSLYNQFLTKYPSEQKAQEQLPDPATFINDEKINAIKKAVVKGKNKEIKKIADELAVAFSSVFAAYFIRISYKDFVENPQLATQEFSSVSNAFFEPLRDLLYQKNLSGGNDDKKGAQLRKNHQKFLGFLLKKSFRLGDFHTAGCLAAYVNKPQNIICLFRDLRFEKYAEYEKNFKRGAMIPFLIALLTDLNLVIESTSTLSQIDRVKSLHDSYKRVQEYQKRAALFPKI